MTDRAQGAVSFTPIVTILADADADAVDAIHHDIKGSLGGEMVYTKADVNDKWVYSTSIDVTGTSADLIASGTAFTEGGTTTTADHVRFLFIKNSGTTDGSTPTDAVVYLLFHAANAATQPAIEIGPNEAFQCKIRDSEDVAGLHAATSTGTVRCTVAAILDDTTS